MILFTENARQIENQCIKHQVRSLFAFGSIVTGNFTDESDIDLIVDFENVKLSEYAENYFSLKSALESIFKRKVDLLEARAIRNPCFIRNIEKSKAIIYGRPQKASLYDILNSINGIESFFAGKADDFDAYENNIRVLRMAG